MNDEILDENFDEVEETYEVGNKPIHASKSIYQLIFSILIYGVVYICSISIFDSFYGEEKIEILIIGFIVGLSVFLLNLFGMINASKSERYQEQTSWKKYVGAVGNMLMFFPSFLFFLEFLTRSIYFFIKSV